MKFYKVCFCSILLHFGVLWYTVQGEPMAKFLRKPNPHAGIRNNYAFRPTNDSVQVEDLELLRNLQQQWIRIKTIISVMNNQLYSMREPESVKEFIPHFIITKLNTFGDFANMVISALDATEYPLKNVIMNKITNNLLTPLIIGNKMLSGLKEISYSILTSLMQMLAESVNVKENIDTEFMIDSLKQAGFKEGEINKAFVLLDIDDGDIWSKGLSSRRARLYEERYERIPNYESLPRDSGYDQGHYGYGYSSPSHNTGYGYNKGVDSFAVIAVMAFTALLAPLVYCVVSSKMGKREVPDFSLTFQMPKEEAEEIIHFLESKEKRKEWLFVKRMPLFANKLWDAYSTSNQPVSCAVEIICEQLKSSNDVLSIDFSFENALLSLMLRYAGVSLPDKMKDKYAQEWINGNLSCPSNCENGYHH